jgi:hypothetical protein
MSLPLTIFGRLGRQSFNDYLESIKDNILEGAVLTSNKTAEELFNDITKELYFNVNFDISNEKIQKRDKMIKGRDFPNTIYGPSIDVSNYNKDYEVKDLLYVFSVDGNFNDFKYIVNNYYTDSIGHCISFIDNEKSFLIYQTCYGNITEDKILECKDKLEKRVEEIKNALDKMKNRYDQTIKLTFNNFEEKIIKQEKEKEIFKKLGI